jgi:hypothetical protein
MNPEGVCMTMTAVVTGISGQEGDCLKHALAGAGAKWIALDAEPAA